MNLIAIHELKSPRTLRERLKREGQLVLTTNGRPVAILLDLPEGEDPEEALDSVRTARSQLALRRLREAARKAGKETTSARQVQELILRARAARKRPR